MIAVTARWMQIGKASCSTKLGSLVGQLLSFPVLRAECWFLFVPDLRNESLHGINVSSTEQVRDRCCSLLHFLDEQSERSNLAPEAFETSSGQCSTYSLMRLYIVQRRLHKMINRQLIFWPAQVELHCQNVSQAQKWMIEPHPITFVRRVRAVAPRTAITRLGLTLITIWRFWCATLYIMQFRHSVWSLTHFLFFQQKGSSKQKWRGTQVQLWILSYLKDNAHTREKTSLETNPKSSDHHKCGSFTDETLEDPQNAALWDETKYSKDHGSTLKGLDYAVDPRKMRWETSSVSSTSSTVIMNDHECSRALSPVTNIDCPMISAGDRINEEDPESKWSSRLNVVSGSNETDADLLLIDQFGSMFENLPRPLKQLKLHHKKKSTNPDLDEKAFFESTEKGMPEVTDSKRKRSRTEFQNSMRSGHEIKNGKWFRKACHS